MKTFKYLIAVIFIFQLLKAEAQNKVDVLTVPSVNSIAKINEHGNIILPSYRFVTPAGD